MDSSEITHVFREVMRDVMPDIVREIMQEANAQDKLLSVDEVADRIGVSARTVETLISDGEIVPIRIRRRRLFHPLTIDAFVRSKAEE